METVVGSSSSLSMLIPQLRPNQPFTAKTQVTHEPSRLPSLCWQHETQPSGTFIHARKGRRRLRFQRRPAEDWSPEISRLSRCFLSTASAPTRDDRTGLVLGNVQTRHVISARITLQVPLSSGCNRIPPRVRRAVPCGRRPLVCQRLTSEALTGV